jgi:4-carboxymuconolactone decarboxylase
MTSHREANRTPVHPTEAEPRISPIPTENMRPEWLATLERIPGDGLKGSGFPHNVLGTLMHSPETFGPFLDYWVTCKTEMSLSVREQELVILRMGCLYRSDYVWKHHVPVAREFGVGEDELAAVREARFAAVSGARERAFLALTDELVVERTIRAEVWRAYREILEDQDLVDLISLVSQYVLFALVNNAMQMQVEEPLHGIPGLSQTANAGGRAS